MVRRWKAWAALGAAAVALGAAALPGQALTGASVPTGVAHVARVCSVGFYRCLSLIRTDLAKVPSATSAHDGYGPAALHSAYRLPWRGGTGRTVAVVDAYDDPNAEADLAVYRSYYHLPPCTTANGCFRKLNQLGAPAPLPTPDVNWALEESLDIQMVSAVCPRCRIVLVEASSADETNTTNDAHSDLADAAATAAGLPGVVAVSNSYGSFGPEPDEPALDAKYDHPGVAVTVSSGDYGYGASWPAASRYVVAVGGTTLTRDSASRRGWSESAWESPTAALAIPQVTGAAGSGCSLWEPKPAWQTDRGCTRRTIADVAAVADPNTGVAVYDSYPSASTSGWTVVGGTSVSSPIVASVYALAGNRGATTSGSVAMRYPAARLYARPRYLYDITTGKTFPVPAACTGGGYVCQAGRGYDGPTGNGTPDGLRAFAPARR